MTRRRSVVAELRERFQAEALVSARRARDIEELRGKLRAAEGRAERFGDHETRSSARLQHGVGVAGLDAERGRFARLVRETVTAAHALGVPLEEVVGAIRHEHHIETAVLSASSKTRPA